MLGFTATNQAASSNNIGYYGYGASDSCTSGASASGLGFGSSAGMVLDEDMMDPLFDEDWLREHNLDILFDLFEEEIESKCGVESNNGSSTLFGTSPVTSHLFGTSPSLAFDLLYFDNQQQQQQQQQQHQPNSLAQNCNVLNYSLDSTNIQQQQTNAINNKLDTTITGSSNTSIALNSSPNDNIGKLHQLNQPSNANGAAAAKTAAANKNSSTNTITQVMRIKRGLKKGQCEGVSLLARPLASSNNGDVNTIDNNNNNNNSSSSSSSPNNIAKTLKFSTSNGSGGNSSSSCSGKIVVTKNNSDKTSVKITNFKNSILGKNDNNKVTNGVEINYSKQSQNYRYLKHNCQQHVHYITGRAVIREHAYAVRGH